MDNNIKNNNYSDSLNTIAMFDGTWQKHGHSSLTGAVTCISPQTGKIMDIHIMNTTCLGCKEKTKYMESAEYNWHAEYYPKCQRTMMAQFQ